MSRLYDRMRRPNGFAMTASHRADVVRLLTDVLAGEAPPPQIIDASNMVREIGNASTSSAGTGFDPSRGQIVAPPFSLCMIEAKTEGLAVRGLLEGFARAPHAMGVLMSSIDLWSVENEFFAQRGENTIAVDKELVRWGVLAVTLLEGTKNGVGLPLSAVDWYVGPDGRMTRAHKDHFLSFSDLVTGDDLGLPNDFIESLSISWILPTALHAVALLNCKNVVRREHVPPRKLSRKHDRRHGLPLTRYYTLEVPGYGGGEAREHGQNKEVNAFHLCRGHFKTYTEAKPLFGRLVGTYWWPQTVRGSRARGEVVKDYAVKAAE